MAHVKGVGTTRLGRDSQSQRLGLKLADGQMAKPGAIIVRQRGFAFRPGIGVGVGKDHTLFALTAGKVTFVQKSITKFTGKRANAVFASVLPVTQ